jgi:hypothetical protein
MNTKSVIPVLKVTPDRVMEVGGNFEDIERYLLQREAEVKAMELTPANMDLVKAVNKEVVAYRTSFARLMSDKEKRYFKDPQAIFRGRASPVIAAIARMEALTRKVLDKEEEDRVSRLTELFDIYKERLQKEYQLTPQFLSRITYRKEYYNKTADEKVRLEDFRAQFTEAKQDQTRYEAAVSLVKRTCAEDSRLDEARWVQELDAFDAAEVLEHIGLEQNRLAALEAPAVEAEVVDSRKVVLGATPALTFKTDFPGRMKTALLEITYPCDAGEVLKALFRDLKQAGFKTRIVKKEAVA